MRNLLSKHLMKPLLVAYLICGFVGILRIKWIGWEIEALAQESSKDPTIEQLASAIKVQTHDLPTDQARLVQLNLARTAMNTHLEYDLSVSDTLSVPALVARAKARGERVWRGDCKSQAVVLSAILIALNIQHSVEVRSGYIEGHAWIRAEGFDINQLADWVENPLPLAAPSGKVSRELAIASGIISNTQRVIVAAD